MKTLLLILCAASASPVVPTPVGGDDVEEGAALFARSQAEALRASLGDDARLDRRIAAALGRSLPGVAAEVRRHRTTRESIALLRKLLIPGPTKEITGLKVFAADRVMSAVATAGAMSSADVAELATLNVRVYVNEGYLYYRHNLLDRLIDGPWIDGWSDDAFLLRQAMGWSDDAECGDATERVLKRGEWLLLHHSRSHAVPVTLWFVALAHDAAWASARDAANSPMDGTVGWHFTATRELYMRLARSGPASSAALRAFAKARLEDLMTDTPAAVTSPECNAGAGPPILQGC